MANDFQLAPPGVELTNQHIQQVLTTWTGKEGVEGVPLRLTTVDDPSRPAAQISNADPDGGHLTVLASDGETPILTVTDDGVAGTFTGPFGETGDLKQSIRGGDHGPWLLCNGRSLATAAYPALSALARPIFGGASADTFRLPDVAGRVLGGPGGSLGALGASAGAATAGSAHSHPHSHSADAHNHGVGTYAVASHSHGLNGHTHDQVQHAHFVGGLGSSNDNTNVQSGSGNSVADSGHSHTGSTNTDGAATTGGSTANSAATAPAVVGASASVGSGTSISSVSGGGPVSTIQPTLVVNVFIHS